MKEQSTQVSILKPTLILATLLFLLAAPAPDSQDIAEMTAYFLIADNHSGLQASEELVKPVEEEQFK